MKRVKKIAKISAISLGALVLLLIIAALIVSRILVTPEKLTPIVNKQAARFISCEYQFGNVELSIFKTFPDIGIQINDLVLINPMPGSPSDTLARVKECVASLNIKEMLKRKVIINKFHLKDGFANLFIDKNGRQNFDVFISNDSGDSSKFKINGIDLKEVDVKRTQVIYTDKMNHISAKMANLNTSVCGTMKDEVIDGKVKLTTGNVSFSLTDEIPMIVKSGNINIDFDGKLSALDKIDGKFSLDLQNAYVRYNDTLYVDKTDASFSAPLQLSINNRSFATNRAVLKIKEHLLMIKGNAAYRQNGDIEMALNMESETWNIEKLLTLIPEDYLYLTEGIDIKGNVAFTGALHGTYNDTLLPSISVGVKLDEGTFNYSELPHHFRDISSEIHLDLADDGKTNLRIDKLEAKTGLSSLSAKGSVRDLMNEAVCNVQAKGLLNLPELQPLLPKEMTTNGQMGFSVQGDFTLEQIIKMELDKIKAYGFVNMDNLTFNYADSLFVKGESTMIDFSLPPLNAQKTDYILSAKVETGFLSIFMTDLMNAELKDAHINITTSNFLDTTKLPFADCVFNMGNLSVKMDTLSVNSTAPNGEITLKPSNPNALNPEINFTFSNSQLVVENGNAMKGSTDNLTLSGHAVYDDKKEDILLQWNPKLKVGLTNALLTMADFPLPVEIPNISFDFTPGKFDIAKSKIILGNSIFNLSGLVTDIDQYLNKTGLLKGNLEFISDFVDANQLMDLFNGFGTKPDSTQIEEMENKTDNPFIVPHGIYLTLKTGAKKALFKETELFNLEGQLTIKDGILILEEMGFTSEAAIMQLTAMYRTPRMNHIFAGIDLHLFDVDIAKLLKMIPFVDQTIPMLHSFEGNAEFHFAIETYLKSNYDIKYSTLRGALAISGDSLVLLDGEDFSNIAKTLKFNKKTRNLIDSLAVELTIFKNEIDVYPFEIVMDKYKAVLSGRHNYRFEKTAQKKDTLTMSYDYHISITDTPLPVRLGLDVTGTSFTGMKYKLVSCQYPHLFQPGRQRAVEKEALYLKKMIRESLKANVKTENLPK